MLAMNLTSPSLPWESGQGGRGLLRRPSTPQSHPISAPMGATPWPSPRLLQPGLPPFPRGGGPLASEATTLLQGSCTFSQVRPRLPWRPRPHLHNRALHLRPHRGFPQGREVLLSGLALWTGRRTVSGSHGHTQTCSWSQNAHPGLEPPEATRSLKERLPWTRVCPGSGICQIFVCLPGKQSQWGSIHAGEGSLRRRPRSQGAVVKASAAANVLPPSASLKLADLLQGSTPPPPAWPSQARPP